MAHRQQFHKAEATSEDLFLILNTIWQRADLAPCEPDVRTDFCIAILLAGITGFRPGALVPLRYDQVELSLIRDPTTRRTMLTATIRLFHNKLRQCSDTQDDV